MCVLLRFYLLSSLCITIIFASTLYVSPDGNNTNSGLSTTSALRTLSAAALKFHFNSYDAVLIRRNSTFINDPFDVNLVKNGFFLSSYGNETLPRPLLQHARGLNNLETSCIRLNGNLNHLKVSNIHLSGCSRGMVHRKLSK